MVKTGNCGSPFETKVGWLVLTHGGGPMRRYCIGAVLLDLRDPSKVIGRLKEPLLKPEENEREVNVPNVVYNCGTLLHGSELIIPLRDERQGRAGQRRPDRRTPPSPGSAAVKTSTSAETSSSGWARFGKRSEGAERVRFRAAVVFSKKPNPPNAMKDESST